MEFTSDVPDRKTSVAYEPPVFEKRAQRSRNKLTRLLFGGGDIFQRSRHSSTSINTHRSRRRIHHYLFLWRSRSLSLLMTTFSRPHEKRGRSLLPGKVEDDGIGCHVPVHVPPPLASSVRHYATRRCATTTPTNGRRSSINTQDQKLRGNEAVDAVEVTRPRHNNEATRQL